MTNCYGFDTEAYDNFYSHAREGRDGKRSTVNTGLLISTHTPARGVTGNAIYNMLKRNISTHTPARGVTITLIDGENGIRISTHTPARGVTRKNSVSSERNEFLLTRPRGA